MSFDDNLAGDVEGHLGLDGRMYLLDLGEAPASEHLSWLTD